VINALQTPFPRSYWVIPGKILAGAFPGDKDSIIAQDKLQRLFDIGIRCIVNLMQPDETNHDGQTFADYSKSFNEIADRHQKRVECLRLPIRDLCIPSATKMKDILDTIDKSVDMGQPVYIHCWGGIGRTGTTVGCYLMRHRIADSDTVIGKIKRLRRGDAAGHRSSPETAEQAEFVKNWPASLDKPPSAVDRYLGCMLGGAIGDALGAPVEFLNLADIRRKYGSNGISGFDRSYGRKGAITDDTQMALFTAEGLLRAFVRGNERGICHPPSVVHHAYVQWLNSQGEASRSHWNDSKVGWLHSIPELKSRRAPGNTCLSALRQEEMGTKDRPHNDSKGCGGVMRVAPVGLMETDPEWVFEMACDIAAITHGHPSGYLAAGTFAALICTLKDGMEIIEAVQCAQSLLSSQLHHEECSTAVQKAVGLAGQGSPTPEKVETLGAGWVAEEALAISVYCALVSEDDYSRGTLLAVNHSGDSDSTGCITGHILGCKLGLSAIPHRWVSELELSDLIRQISQDLWIRYLPDDAWYQKYPGW